MLYGIISCSDLHSPDIWLSFYGSVICNSSLSSAGGHSLTKIHSPLKDQLELSANRDSWDLCMCTAVLCNGKEAMRTSFFHPINYWESVTSNVPVGRGHHFPGEEFDSVVHLFTLGNILMGWGHIHPWVIVHCVLCSAIMDSLSTHWPCLLLERVLNNRSFVASAWKILPSKGLECFNKAESSNIIKKK